MFLLSFLPLWSHTLSRVVWETLIIYALSFFLSHFSFHLPRMAPLRCPTCPLPHPALLQAEALRKNGFSALPMKRHHPCHLAPARLTFPVTGLGKKLGYGLCVRCSKGLSEDSDGRAGNDNLTELDEQSLLEELQAAIRSENYVKAAKLRDELRLLQEDNRSRVITANAKFYKAFELGDTRLMRTLWSKGENVHCIHPGAGCISGYDLVMASWELMLGPELALPLKIDLENLEVHVKGNLAFVTCVEVVRTSGSSWGKQVATNVFEKQNGNWSICLHHASHITT